MTKRRNRMMKAKIGTSLLCAALCGAGLIVVGCQRSLPSAAVERLASAAMLSKWLGTANSFYKCAILFELDGQWLAASMQWDCENHVCVYFPESLSHVNGYPDAEHEANIQKVTH